MYVVWCEGNLGSSEKWGSSKFLLMFNQWGIIDGEIIFSVHGNIYVHQAEEAMP